MSKIVGLVFEAKTAKKSIDKMTVDELKAYAAEKEIDLTDITVKADILAKIKDAEGGAENGDH